MSSNAERKGLYVLASGMALMLVLGSVHAFSVFLEPLEARFAAARGEVSLTYSLALGFLTVSVLFGHLIYGRLRPPVLAMLLCALAAAGCGLAAVATTLPMVWLGYGVLFGAANGLGYGFALQSSAQANPNWKGLAVGLITACYALSAVGAPFAFDALLGRFGFPGAMMGLAAILVVIAPVAAGLLAMSAMTLQVSASPGTQAEAPGGALMFRLWLAYGAAVTAGLMAIGHATGIARSAGLGDSLVLGAPVVIAAANMVGSVLGGWLADRVANRLLLLGLPVMSAAALLALAAFEGAGAVLAGLAVIGFCYGAIITVYPAVISDLFGAVAGIRAYGRVFTAWGAAGLAAPVFAGYLFERSGDYQVALLVASGAGLVSAGVAMTIAGENRS